MGNLVPILISTIALATVLNVLLKRFNIPTIIGYILSGAVIGTVFQIHFHDNPALEHIAEFGVVFLMFTIGLEFSVAHLNSMKKEVFLFGTLQVVLTAAVLSLIAWYFFGLEIKTSVVVGSGFALSSTAIVLKILTETGKIKSPFGQNALGILIFQDIAVVPILLMITIFSDTGSDLFSLLQSTAINALLAVVILVVIGKFVLRHVFKIVSNTNSKEIYMGSILFTVIGASYLAHHFGFSYSLGGFIAGMMIADTIYKYQVEADLIPFRDLLLGVFFVSVGLQIDIYVIQESIVPVLLLVVGVMALKLLMTFAILIFSNKAKDALKTAVTLSQVGEFSLVVFSLISANKLLDPNTSQIIMVSIVISMILTPFLINNLDAITNLIFKEDVSDALSETANAFGDHIILCGYGSFGRVVSERLDQAKINHIIVTNNTDSYVKAKEADKDVVFGDAADRSLLQRLRISDAMSTVVAVDDFDEVKRISAAVTLIDPKLKIIAKVPSEEKRAELHEFHHELLLDGNSSTANQLVDQIQRSQLLAAETARLEHLSDYDIKEPGAAITKVYSEQRRLLEIIAKSFNGLREGRDILYIKAFHDSFRVLSEIILRSIDDIMNNADLAPAEYERINTLLDNHHKLVSLNQAMESLGKRLKDLKKLEKTSHLAEMAVEGLDTILLSLIDMAKEYDEADSQMLQSMIKGSGDGLYKIRESYLSDGSELENRAKALLVASTNEMDRVKTLFGEIGSNYAKLSC